MWLIDKIYWPSREGKETWDICLANQKEYLLSHACLPRANPPLFLFIMGGALAKFYGKRRSERTGRELPRLTRIKDDGKHSHVIPITASFSDLRLLVRVHSGAIVSHTWIQLKWRKQPWLLRDKASDKLRVSEHRLNLRWLTDGWHVT